ncbi:hypothetical protein I5I01_gp57 [Mycobacterium phage MooMoo]|uniref:Uncharacterized protein n=1 Tax=Mycobacterium phage MooMoo TaxID=2108127 RepID=A0A2P1JRD7_9CAUD|nr:hypothetical protein I5I01_gp57 [Mycobacterium phage MooMoo]AVO21662.1 hypothetical protein SEA_MOOMOO_57 [Mycobacterium phage MooMoo]
MRLALFLTSAVFTGAALASIAYGTDLVFGVTSAIAAGTWIAGDILAWRTEVDA